MVMVVAHCRLKAAIGFLLRIHVTVMRRMPFLVLAILVANRGASLPLDSCSRSMTSSLVGFKLEVSRFMAV